MKSQYLSLSYLLDLAKYLSLLSMLSLMSGFHSVWFPYCIVGSDLLIFCWRFLHVYLSRISSVQSLSRIRFFATPWTAARQTSLSPTPEACLNSYPVSQWCHPAISSSVVPFSSCLQSFPASGSFPMSQFFASGGQSIGVSASASVLPMNIQDWFPLGLTGFISLKPKRLSRVFSNTTVQKHQSFGLSFLHSPTLTSIYDY